MNCKSTDCFLYLGMQLFILKSVGSIFLLISPIKKTALNPRKSVGWGSSK